MKQLYYKAALALLSLATILLSLSAIQAQSLSLDINNNPHSISNFDGHNASFLNEVFHCDYNGGFNAYGYGYMKQISPKLLRYPGGKLSQYAHLMQGPGFGLDSTEIIADFSGQELNEWLMRLDNQDTLTCRYIDAFIDFVADNNDPDLEVLFVVNLDHGTVQENVNAVSHLINNGVNITGIEMGNEHYRNSAAYPTVADYMSHAIPYANAILAAHPNLKIGWVAAPPITANQQIFSTSSIAHFQAWNQGLVSYKDEPYFDAYISHIYYNAYYFQASNLYNSEYDNNNLNTLNNTFSLGVNLFNSYIRDSVPAILNEYEQLFGTNEKLWITEWNIAKPSEIYGNTILDASYTTKFIHQINRLNPGKNNMVEYMCRQKLAGPFFNTQNSITPKSSWDDISVPYVKRTSYYPFLLFNELYESDYKLLTTNTSTGGILFQVFAQAYYDETTNDFLIVIVNENGVGLQMAPSDINVTDWAGNPVNYTINSPYSIEYISGNKLYSSAGVTNYFYQNVNYSTTFKPPFEIDDVQSFQWAQSATSLTIPPRSISVLRFRAENVLSVNETTLNASEIELFPNPSTTGTQLSIQMERQFSGAIRLYDVSGKLLKTEHVNNESNIQLTTNTLNAGLYHLNFTNRDGASVNKQLILSR